MMQKQIISNKKKISEILSVIGIILLMADTVNTFTSQQGYGLLHMTDQQSGESLGISSIVLLFTSFGIGFGLRVRLTTLSLIGGGVLLSFSKLVEPIFGLNLYLAIVLPYLYISLIVMGFTLSGLGLLRVTKKQ
ncbi:MAG TPA: hypothetical protein VGC75_03610 [Candidatus Nitrosocosmicus sp.]